MKSTYLQNEYRYLFYQNYKNRTPFYHTRYELIKLVTNANHNTYFNLLTWLTNKDPGMQY